MRRNAIHQPNREASALIVSLRQMIAQYRVPRDSFRILMALARLTAVMRGLFVDDRNLSIAGEGGLNGPGDVLWQEFEQFVARWSSSVGIAARIESFGEEAIAMFGLLEARFGLALPVAMAAHAATLRSARRAPPPPRPPARQ